MRAFLFLALAVSLSAQSQLLREFSVQFAPPTPLVTADSESFVLTYNDILPGSPFIQSPCLGCGLDFALGWTGSYDFNSTNSVDWVSVVADMTDGRNQQVGVGWLKNQSGVPQTGAIGAEPDNLWLGAPDLAGQVQSIDFIRMDITQDDVTNPTAVQFAATWEVWGTPIGTLPPIGPPPATAPEPAPVEALGLLPLMYAACRRAAKTRRLQNSRS